MKTKNTIHGGIPGYFVPQAQVRGYHAYSKTASLRLRFVAGVIDLSIGVSLFSIVLLLTRWSLKPSLVWIPILIAVHGFYVLIFKLSLGRTLGQFSWQLCRVPPLSESISKWHRGPLLQCETFRTKMILAGSFVTVLSLICAAQSSYEAIFSLPLWMRAEQVNLIREDQASDTVATSESSENSIPLPFFYSFGVWPTTFQGNPIFYRLPYEKGPPTRFLGHITAQWDTTELPAMTLTFEGPKTPLQGFSRTEIQNCLKNSISWNCLEIRHAVLSRHIDEMTRVMRVHSWKLDLFSVKVRDASPQQYTQGLVLSALGYTSRQDRYIVMTEKGIHQTYILTTPRNENGEAARGLFEKSLRSLQSLDDLGPGNAWMDEQLEETDLLDLQSEEEPEVVLNKYAELQALLLAKISVEPQLYETYYHLARLSLDLIQYSSKLLSPPNSETNSHPDSKTTPDSGPEAHRLKEVIASSQGLIESAYRYAQDVNPQEPRNAQIKEFLEFAAKTNL